MSDEVRTNTPPGTIKHFVGIQPCEITDAANDLINDINTQVAILTALVNSISGIGALGGDLSGTLPNPTIAAGAVTSPKMASGAAAANVGALGGDLTGTLPNPSVASAAITAAKIGTGAAATNVGSLGGDLTGTLPNPTVASAAITSSKLASGAAATNVGTLGGVLAGTLPNPTFAASTGLLPWFNVMNYGAVGDGVTDDTTAIDAAIVAANAAGLTAVLYFPANVFKITAALTAISCNVYGDGPNSSFVACPVTVSPFNLTSAATPLAIIGITVEYGSAANAGNTAIIMQATSTVAWGGIVRDVRIINGYVGMELKNLAFCRVDNLEVTRIGAIGLKVDNPLSVDAGASVITGSKFMSINSSTGTGVLWNSSGGLKLIGNEFNVLSVGFQAQLASGAVTAQITVVGNTFDTNGSYSVVISRAGTTGTLINFLVNDNIFSGATNAVTIAHDTTGAWLTNVSVVGNVYSSSGTAGFFASMDSCYNIMVAHNTCYSSVAGNVLYAIAASVTSGVVGPNTKAGTWGSNANFGTAITIIAPN